MNNNRLFVGNLDYSTVEAQLREAFAPFGEVVSATVVVDRMTGQSRGFGFVELQTAEQAERAIQSLDGTVLNGRSINVSIARERKGGGGGGGFGGGGGGGGGRRGGGDDRGGHRGGGGKKRW